MNSHLPVGRLARHLEGLSREEVWLAILAATSIVALLDFQLPAADFAPAYIPVICGASWGLGVREGYFVAAISALLSLASPLAEAGLSALAFATPIRTAAFLFLAATVGSFRRSYDREMFLAHHDSMTGTLNKEIFYRRARAVIRDAANARQVLLLIILDLDDFKSVNSFGGHQAGDEVIRNFAKGLRAIMRREDLVGRIGGDEFSIVMHVPSISEGQSFARSLHGRLSTVLSQERYPVTCSMGALLIPPDAHGKISELMHAADEAMYRAKTNRKNAVEIATFADRPIGVAHMQHVAAVRRKTL
jgi:diguanylate cyclase (GGDEF)-like protein